MLIKTSEHFSPDYSLFSKIINQRSRIVESEPSGIPVSFWQNKPARSISRTLTEVLNVNTFCSLWQQHNRHTTCREHYCGLQQWQLTSPPWFLHPPPQTTHPLPTLTLSCDSVSVACWKPRAWFVVVSWSPWRPCGHQGAQSSSAWTSGNYCYRAI